MTVPPSHSYHHTWIDNGHIVGTRGDFQKRELVSVEVPRSQIEAGALAIESGQEALLRPGHQVSIAVEVGSTRFADRNSVVSSLQELLTKRFAEGGITVAAGQPKVLKVFYSEAQGEELQVVEKGPGPRGRPTGQKVQETVLVLNATLTASGESKPVWEANIRRGNPRIIRAQAVNDAEVRKATFQMLEYLVSSTPIPFFVPADPRAPRLPLLTAL